MQENNICRTLLILLYFYQITNSQLAPNDLLITSRCEFMSFCGVDFLIWFFPFEILKEIFDGWDWDDDTKWYKNDRKSSWGCNGRYHLHDSYDEKVNIGYFWKLNNEIQWYKIQNSVLWCFDGVIADIIIRNVCYYGSIWHLAERRNTGKN